MRYMLREVAAGTGRFPRRFAAASLKPRPDDRGV